MDRKILEGIYDVHVHAGPSNAQRKVDALEMYHEAKEAGYKGFVVKDHYIPALFGTKMIQDHFAEDDFVVRGALVLNNSVGGLNVNMVDQARQLNAAMVYFPTVSAKNHIDLTKDTGFAGAANNDVDEDPIEVLQENGELVPEAIAILKYMAKHDMLLATGHLRHNEVDVLVKKAFELGVKRILITHPHFQVDASIEEMVRWADMGAYIEINACVFDGGGSKIEAKVPLTVAKEMMDAVGVDRMILDSDFGQLANDTPVEGLLTFINILEEKFGITEEDVNVMAKENPKKLFKF